MVSEASHMAWPLNNTLTTCQLCTPVMLAGHIMGMAQTRTHTHLGAFWEDDRKGLPPIPLPCKQPIPQLVVDLLATLLVLLQPAQHVLYSVFLLQAI